MLTTLKNLFSFLKFRAGLPKGQSMVEYGLILVLIALVVVFASLQAFGGIVRAIYNTFSSLIQ